MAAAKKDVSRIVNAAQALEGELERFRTSGETLLTNRLDSGKQLERAAKQLESIASSDERLGACVAELNAAIIEAREKQVGTADQVRAFADSVGERATLFNELMGRYAALGNAARDVGEKMQPASTSDKAELELALGQIEGAIVTLLESADVLKQDALEKGFSDIAQQADAIQKQIRSLQSKIHTVARSAAQA
jgi:chromosome segregation ATPase